MQKLNILEIKIKILQLDLETEILLQRLKFMKLNYFSSSSLFNSSSQARKIAD